MKLHTNRQKAILSSRLMPPPPPNKMLKQTTNHTDAFYKIALLFMIVNRHTFLKWAPQSDSTLEVAKR